jgi:hypothetical protein
MLSMVAEVDNMTRVVHLLRNPDGSEQFPSRSCCDLIEQHPEKESGTYVTYSPESRENLLN